MISEAKPINLKERYGDRFRIFYDESWQHESSEDKAGAKAWCMELRGKYGMVYPKGGGYLVAFTDSYHAMKRLSAMKLERKQGLEPGAGGNEWAFAFPAPRLLEVAAVLKLRKRRQLSEEAKKRLVCQLLTGKNRPQEASKPGQISIIPGVVNG